MTWISVEDRLPESGDVLVINAMDDLGAEIVCVVRKNYIKAANNADFEDFKTRGYTHWMPLPEPPERQG